MVAGGAEIKGLSQFREQINGDKLVIIDFSATWCGPCKVISPVFNQIAASDEYKDKAIFATIDVDEEEEIAQEVGIRAMPTFMFFKNGQKVDEMVGADQSKLRDLVTKNTSA